jgi:hypothetical protein
MTRHKATHTGVGSPSPLDLWINALLHAFAMLVSNVARRLASRRQTPSAECDGVCGPPLEATHVLDQHQEHQPAAGCSQTTTSSNASEGLMLRDRGAIVSKYEAGLIGATPRGTPPLGKGRSEPAKLATGGDHFVPRPQFSLRRWCPRPLREVIPTPTSLRESRTSPFRGEVKTAPA